MVWCFGNCRRRSDRNRRHRDRMYRLFRPVDGDQPAREFSAIDMDDRVGSLWLDARLAVSGPVGSPFKAEIPDKLAEEPVRSELLSPSRFPDHQGKYREIH